MASQKLLASPVARPLINALDYAQRTNTIGSLRADDVSRTIIGTGAVASPSPQPVIIQPPTDNVASAALAQSAAVLSKYEETMNRLSQRLNEPFVTVNTVTGDTGIKQAQEEYDTLIRNYCCPVKLFKQNKLGLTLLMRYQPFWLSLFCKKIYNHEQR